MSLVLLGLIWCLTATVGLKHHSGTTKTVETQIIEIFSSIGVNMCNEKCTTRGSCRSFVYDSVNLVCSLFQRQQDKIEEYGKCVFIPKRNTKVKAGSCSLKTCQGLRCLETHTGKTVCVEEATFNNMPLDKITDFMCMNKVLVQHYKGSCSQIHIRYENTFTLNMNRNHGSERKQLATTVDSAFTKENKQQFLTQPHTKLLSSTIDGDLCGVKLILLEAKAVINTRGLNRRTPLMFAAGKAHKDMFDLLVREGADLSLLDKDRKTVLHIACEGGNIGIVNYILTKDIVGIDNRDNLRQSTVMKAALNGNKDVFEILVGKGTDLSFVDSNGGTILHLACSGGSIEIVNHVLTDTHLDINSRDEEDCTPMLNGAKKGHKHVLDLLVSKGADMALRDLASNTVLHAACEGGNIEIVQYILRQNVTSINARGWKGVTPVLVAADNGHEEVFDLLVVEGADLLIVTDFRDNILHEACNGGNMKLVTYVLNQNIVDINSRGKNGMTPAMITASMGHKDIFDLLQEERADLTQVDEDGNNILHKACEGGNIELVSYVLTKNIVDINSKNMLGTTSAMEAAVGGHKEVLHLLMSTGADLTPVDDEGSDILHIAFSSTDRETVKFILTHSIVNINGSDNEGMTPVLLSAEMGYRDVFDLVVSKGADLSSVDVDGGNIIQKACVGGNLDIVKYILSLNSIVQHINRRGESGWTPVMFAASLGYKDVFDLLVKKGADLTLKNKDRDTILHLACRVNIQIVRYLVSRNIVDINVRGDVGRTPAFVAAGLGNIRIFEELVKKGADPTVTDVYGSTILHHATLGNRVEMVKYIISHAIVDITSKTKHGPTAALIAKQSGFTAVYNVFLSHASL